VEKKKAYKFTNLVSANTLTSLNSTETTFTLTTPGKCNKDTTVIMLILSSSSSVWVWTHMPQAWAITTHALFGPTSQEALNTITIVTLHVIADTGATSIFVMKDINVANKHVASKPLTINFSDGRKVQSTHVCNIAISGLPTVLTGHIIPALAVASLVGIHLLCIAWCWVIFDNNKCDVEFDGNII
jgi:hypothetical protein